MLWLICISLQIPIVPIPIPTGLPIVAADEWFGSYGTAFIFLLWKSSSNSGLYTFTPAMWEFVDDVLDCCLGFFTALSFFLLSSTAAVFLHWAVWCLVVSTPTTENVFFFFSGHSKLWYWLCPLLGNGSDVPTFSQFSACFSSTHTALWSSCWLIHFNNKCSLHGPNPGPKPRVDIQHY